MYKGFFDYAIDTLAGILEKRDDAAQILDGEGEELIVDRTNRDGQTSRVKNPAFAVWDDLNKSALMYWRDLGLTPAGLKKINEEAFARMKEEKNGNSLMGLLQKKKEAEKEG